MEEDNVFGSCYPGNQAITDVVLLLCAQLRKAVCMGVLARREDDTVVLTYREFSRQVAECREVQGAGWSQWLRALSEDKLCREIQAYMVDWMLLAERDGYLLLLPAAAKWTGHFPKSYRPDTERGDIDEPMENE